MRTKRIIGFAVLIVAATCITLATYREFADGAQNPFIAMIVEATGVSFGIYGVARTRWPFGHRGPVVIALAIALPLPIVHAARLLHPAGRGMPLIELHPNLHTNPTSNQDWALTIDPGASISADPEGILIINVPRTRASLEFSVPTKPVWWLAWPLRLLLPVSYDDDQIAETASFDLTIEPLGTFYVVVETEILLIQVNPAGLHLTYRPSGSPAETVESPRGPGSIRGRHRWQVRRTPDWITVDVDGAETFARPRPRPLGFIRLGETRSDEFHGGTMRIHDAQYRRWWAGSRRPWWPS